ncbi:MAG: ABC transporter permease [Candidatus Rokubacteria bacterium]|nr:ABC transporter permease [Candidatus Rokubacteria bacterium]
MWRWVLRRLLWAAFLAWGVASLIFLVINAIPGDPVVIILGEAGGPGHDDAAARELREQLGLDRPLPIRYARWLGGLLTGNLGRSLYTNVPVTRELAEKFPRTLYLVVPAVVLGILAGVPLGVFTATRSGTAWDGVTNALGLLGYSLPVYITGSLLAYLLGVRWRLLPVSGYVDPAVDPLGFARHGLLPILCLAGTVLPIAMRMTRTTMLDVLGEDYIRTARAKGLSPRNVIYRHGLRNALIPVIAVIGLQLGYMFGGTVLTELVFSWPGLSTYLFFGIFKRDYPVVQGVILVLSLIYILINLLIDLSYGLLDPRIRYS